MVQVYTPEGIAGEPENALTRSVASLEGLRIAVLDNEKPNAGLLMKRIAERLVERGAVAGPHRTKLESKAYMPCPGEVIEYLSDNTDLVLTGSADWGSCTSWSVHDLVQLEKLGIPTVVMTTTKFRDLCYQVADQFGVPDARILVVDHPLGATPASTILDWADKAVDDVIKLFTATDHGATTAPVQAAVSAVGADTGVVHDAAVTEAMTELQTVIQADGGELVIDAVDPAAGRVEMSLVLQGAECIECVMPRPFLEQMALAKLTEFPPTYTTVTIHDPREG